MCTYTCVFMFVCLCVIMCVLVFMCQYVCLCVCIFSKIPYLKINK